MTVALNMRSDEKGFAAIVGNDVTVKEKGDVDWSMEDIVKFNFDVEEQPVAFPLEIVEVDGEERCRIPQAIWQAFGQ